MTARDLITRTFRLISVLASTEVPTANEANEALLSLNEMVDSWSNQQLLIPSKVQEVFPLVASQQSYTMGVGGNFNTSRPQKIENASIRTTTGSTTYDLPIEIINQDKWATITIKNVSSALPTKLFEQNTYPLDTIYLWPMPSDASKSVVLWSWKPLTTFTSLDTVVSLPPGYSKMIRYNLGVELAPEYSRQLDPIIIAQAVDMKADVKRMNNKTLLMGQDAAVMPGKASFNYLTGD